MKRVQWQTLKMQLLATYFLLILVSVGGMSLWMAPHFQREAEEQVEHELELEAHLLAATLRDQVEDLYEEAEALPALQRLVSRYSSHSGSRVVVLDASYRVLAVSDASLKIEQEQPRPEFAAAALGQEQHDVRMDEYSGEERVFVAAPLQAEDGDYLLGYVQVSVPMWPVRLSVYRAWGTMAGIVLLVLAVTAGVSLWLANSIVSPLHTLTQAVEKAAEGNFQQHVAPDGPEEIRRLTQAFNRMSSQLARLLQRQRDFTANAAHELRSPLTALRLRLEMLRDHPEDRDLQARYLQEMIAEVDHLRTMVSQLLDLAAADEETEVPPPLDFAPWLYQVVDELMPLFAAKQVQLTVDSPSHLPPARIRAAELQVILRNLLDNARKYTPSGGQVRLCAFKEGNWVVVQVRDNGPGIAPEAQERIFERFYRLEAGRSGGSGLGLALARALVLRNEGQIHLESEPGKGTVFTVRFPISAKDEKA